MRMNEQIKELQAIIEDSKNIVFFGGAGVSTESGIPDFRSSEGIYHKECRYPPETVVSRSFFMQKPEMFFDFYKEHMVHLDVKPNPAHQAIASFEKVGKVKAVVTQNIDGLHQMAGSSSVLELHRSVHRNYCMKCNQFYDANYVKESREIPRCSCGGIIKPDIVLYEEGLDSEIIQKSVDAIRKADTLIIGGTSLSVYPAAGFVDYFKGRHLVVINRDEMTKKVHADLIIHDSIGEVFKNLPR